MKMGLKPLIVGALFAVVVLVPRSPAKENQQQEQAVQLLKKVQDLTDIRLPGARRSACVRVLRRRRWRAQRDL